MNPIVKSLFTILLASATSTVGSMDNWPQWRGSNFDGISRETNLPTSFAKENQLWRVELPGPGGASPIVWEDNIFVSTVDGTKLALMCFGIDGQMKWQQPVEGRNQNIRMDSGNSASPSPVTDGKHVWVMMTTGILHCFTFDGELKWKQDMQDKYGRFEIQFGMTSTPILDKGKLYFQFIHGDMRDRSATSTGQLIALNADDGSEVWTHVRKTDAIAENKHAYTTPAIFRNDEREFIIVHGGDYTTGHSLKDGNELWRIGGLNPKGADYNPFLRFVASPTCSKSLIVIPSAKSGPVIGVSPDVTGSVMTDDDAVVWQLERGTPDVSTPVISNGLVYLARENGVFMCLDAKTGEKLYEQRLLRDKHRSSPVAANSNIYLVGRDGTAVVIAEGRDFKLVSQTDLDEDTTASPAISNGRIYVRSNESLMAFGKVD